LTDRPRRIIASAILDSIHELRVSLSSIVIGKSVESIGAEAFRGCGGPSIVTFQHPSRLSVLREGVFRDYRQETLDTVFLAL
jgi:hypothetical protein